MALSFKIYVDWNNDGDFGDTNEDISDDVMFVTIERGKDEELGKVAAGTCDIRVKNSDSKYCPEYSSSPLYGNNKPGRAVKVEAVLDAATKEMFYGYIYKIVPNPHWSEQTAYIYCIDGMDSLAAAEIMTSLYEDQNTGYLIGKILDSANWSATMRTLDNGQDTIPYGYWYRNKALSAINSLEDSELSMFYVGKDGYARWEDRHHRLKSPHTVSQGTFTNTMCEISYSYSNKNVYNDFIATYIPRTEGSLTDIAYLREIISFAPAEVKIFYTEYGGPATDVVTPVSTTDYTANTEYGGGGDDKTSDIGISFTNYACAAKIQVTNNASVSVYLTLLKVRGKLITEQENVSKKSEDTTSQNDYGKRSLDLSGEFLHSSEVAQDFVNFAKSRYIEPQSEITVTNKRGFVSGSNTILTQMLDREISDRITVQHTKLGVDDDYFINKIRQEIQMKGKLLTTEWVVTLASDEEYWILGTSQLGSETRLAY